jgi:hypothetical protein
MNNQVITPVPQSGERYPLHLYLSKSTEPFPMAADGVDLCNVRMAFQHRGSFVVNQRIYFTLRRGIFECSEHRGRKQDIAMMAQLDDQGTG